MRAQCSILLLWCTLAAAAPAHAWELDVRVAARNHALYAADVHGRPLFQVDSHLPVRRAGAIQVRRYAFSSTQQVYYLAAWSDDPGELGLLAQLELEGLLNWSNETEWQVYATDLPAADGAAPPGLDRLGRAVGEADAQHAWAPVESRGSNRAADGRSELAEFVPHAEWIWASARGLPAADTNAPGRLLIFRIHLFTPKPEISALYSDYPEGGDAGGPRVSNASAKWGGGGGGGLTEGSGAVDPITAPAEPEYPPDPPLPGRPRPRERVPEPPTEGEPDPPPVEIPPPGGSFPIPPSAEPRSGEPVPPAVPAPTEEGGATAPPTFPPPRIPEPTTAGLLLVALLVVRRR